MFQFKMYRKLQITCVPLLALVLIIAPSAFCHSPSSSALKQDGETDTRMAKTNWRHNDDQSLELYTPDQLEIVETYLIGGDHLINQQSLAQADYAVMVVQLLSKPYITTFTHWYEESGQELTKWGGPEANQELCLQQLEGLNRRLQRHYEEKRSGKDTNFYQLLDTYEWYGSGTYLGNNEWLGNYNECLRLKINTTEGLIATRYCSGAFKHNKWPHGNKVDQLMAMRAGVCLPKSCDSIRYKNKFQLIENLVNFKARKVDEGDVYLDYLYCLPDEQSKARLWYYSPKTAAFVGALASWITLMMFCTFKYKTCEKKSAPDAKNHRAISLYKSLSVIENVKSLLKTSSPQDENLKRDTQVVNLDVVEGIKVLTMCYVITGHTLMCFTQITNNGREMSRPDLSNVIFLAADRLPGLTVNVFFSITGILTAYLLFKSTKPIKFITSPAQWIIFVALRYIRIMPLYALVVAYEKYLAKYTGSGPLWDYGTSSLSPRTRCEQEPWSDTLLFAANMKHPLASCIPAAWYLANDFQFFLATPIFLALLEKRPKWGNYVSIGAIIVGSILAAIRIASSGHDLSPMVKFLPHGFNIYLYFLGDTYTFPHYRIPAYLCGLLFGHALYQYEQRKLVESSKNDLGTKVDWPEWMRRFGSQLFVLTIVACLSVPLIRHLLPKDRFYTSIIVGFMTPAFNLLFAFTGGLYVLLTATGHGNRAVIKFLSSPIWKVLSRLNLCVLLINICVINYFAQTATHLIYFDFKIMAALYLFSIFMSYLVAAVVCVLFESPLRIFINMYLMAPLKGQLKKEHKD